MKASEFKNIIKQSVKEAIQEELKDILLEAIRSPKQNINESVRDNYAQPHIENPKTLTAAERHAMFGGMLKEMQTGGVANSSYVGDFNSSIPVDTINGALPEGQVSLENIMALMNK
jgi:hypothetical protein